MGTPKDNESFVRAIFQKWDENLDLQLDENEFVRLFTDLGLSDASAKQIFKVVDMDDDGYVDSEELLDWLEFSGKSSYVTGGGMCSGTGSKEAAAQIKKELKEKPPEGPIFCCEVTTTLATLRCVQCNKFYSNAGFQKTHDKGDMALHTYVPVKQKQTEQSTHRDKAIQMIEAARKNEHAVALERELKKQFKVYDIDANGSISMEEMSKVAIAMNIFVGSETTDDSVRNQVYNLFKKLDINKDGQIVISEFVEALLDNAIMESGPELAARQAKEMTETISFAMKRTRGGKKKP